MPPIPPIPPMPPGIAGSLLGISVTTASAVVSSDATPAASVSAVLTTCPTHLQNLKFYKSRLLTETKSNRFIKVSKMNDLSSLKYI